MGYNEDHLHVQENYPAEKGTPLNEKQIREVQRTCRPIPGFPSYWIDEIGNTYKLEYGKPTRYGRVMPHQLKAFTDKHGYKRVRLTLWFPPKDPQAGDQEYRRSPLMGVHQLVAITFIGPKPGKGKMVCHKDGIEGNNHYLNLYWGTAGDNGADKVWHAKVGKGNRHSTRPAVAKRKDTSVHVSRNPSIDPTEIPLGVNRSMLQLIDKYIRTPHEGLWCPQNSQPGEVPATVRASVRFRAEGDC